MVLKLGNTRDFPWSFVRHASHRRRVTTEFLHRMQIRGRSGRPELLIVRADGGFRCSQLEAVPPLNGTRRDANEMQIAVNSQFSKNAR